MMTDAGRHCVFLDRDGVINEEVEYLHDPAQLVLIAGVASTIRALVDAGALVVVVTNQAGIGRGMYSEADLAGVTARLDELLAASGTALAGSYFCPHHPTAGIGEYRIACRCRKPEPGMLLDAAADLGIDLARSVMVGDKATDLAAGRAAGCHTVLVRTGYGAAEEVAARAAGLCDAVFDSLADAGPYLLARL